MMTMSDGSDPFDRLNEDQALRCRNTKRGLSWVFTVEDGDVIRSHEDGQIETKQVSRDMAALSIDALAVEVEIVPIEEIERSRRSE